MESGKCANQDLTCHQVVFTDAVEQVKALKEAKKAGFKLPTSTEMCVQSCDQEINLLGYKLKCEASTNFLFF